MILYIFQWSCEPPAVHSFMSITLHMREVCGRVGNKASPPVVSALRAIPPVHTATFPHTHTHTLSPPHSVLPSSPPCLQPYFPLSPEFIPKSVAYMYMHNNVYVHVYVHVYRCELCEKVFSCV